MTTQTSLKKLFSIGLLALACALPSHAVEVGGVKIDDAATVDGAALKLNGAGIRTKVFFKVYAMGLYLTDKKTASKDVQALAGPKRMTIVMMREVSSADLTKSFMEALDHNSNTAEKAKISDQTQKFEAMFASIPATKKGDVIMIDWLPASGTVVQFNGKPLGSALPDAAFYNALLRIWLGDRPADGDLKKELLNAG